MTGDDPRRRLRLGGGQPGEPPGAVPGYLRRYNSADWLLEGDAEPMIDGHRRWREARIAWAEAHGYDVHARWGEKPGHDWWAFLVACGTTAP